jgi:hypothetical protein
MVGKCTCIDVEDQLFRVNENDTLTQVTSMQLGNLYVSKVMHDAGCLAIEPNDKG